MEALVFNPPGLPVSAVTTNGDISYGGDTHVTGTCGNIHANGDMTLGGSTSIIDGNATATGTVNPGTSVVNGLTISGAPNVPVPDLNPADYKKYADYELRLDGNIYDSSGTQVGSSPWNDWTFNGGHTKMEK